MPAKLQQLQNLFFEGASQEEFLRVHHGEKRTWKYLYGEKPDLLKHIQGKTYYGVKRGTHTRFIVLDFDNHHWEHDFAWHCQRVFGAIRRLLDQDCRVLVEVNEENGSTKVFIFLPRPLTIARARQRAGQLLARLDEELPGYNYAAAEFFPGKLSGYYLPFRFDKVTAMPGMYPALAKQSEQLMEDEAAAVLRYLVEGNEPINARVMLICLECLLQAIGTVEPLEKPQPSNKPQPPDKPQTKSPKKRSTDKPGGYGTVPPAKNNLARTQQQFWNEKLPIEPDTVDKYVVQALRTQIRVFGMTGDQALDWCETRLRQFKNTAYSDRLTFNPEELFRTMAYAAKAIEKENGYQADIAKSNAIWSQVKSHWSRKGIRTWEELLDGGTFRSHNTNMRLTWTKKLLDLLPEIADILHTIVDLAKNALEMTLRHVHNKSELSLSLISKLLVSCGIKGYSQKAFEFRKLLVDREILVLKHRYGGYGDVRHGNFYYCSLAVNFMDEEEKEASGGTPFVSIDYPSTNAPLLLSLEVHRRQMDCDARFRTRWKAIFTRQKQAA